MKKRLVRLPVLCLILALLGCAGIPLLCRRWLQNRQSSTELYAMDTVMTLTAYGPHASEGIRNAAAEIRRLDRLLSISSEDGDIFRLNRDGEAVLSPDTEALLRRSQEVSAETGGLFDCTIEPVMEAWGFTTQQYQVPSPAALERLRSRVDYRQLTLQGSHAFLPKDVRVDLGGIAKGYTSARVMDLFKDAGISSAIVSLGGNVQALGSKPDGTPWQVGIEDPADTSSIFASVAVRSQAVITSGAYQRFFEENGTRYHHIIDPRTGYPSRSGLSSVTIVSSDGTLADALSTSLFLMGAEDAAAFWRKHSDEFDAVLVTDDGQVMITSGLADSFTVYNGRKVQVIS